VEKLEGTWTMEGFDEVGDAVLDGMI